MRRNTDDTFYTVEALGNAERMSDVQLSSTSIARSTPLNVGPPLKARLSALPSCMIQTSYSFRSLFPSAQHRQRVRIICPLPRCTSEGM